jgi:hypothetical protein
MSLFKSLSIDEIRQRGTIRDVDVRCMRRWLDEDGTISALEADLLLMLNNACRIKDASWASLFVDAVTDYLVHQAAPEGYITSANADWLTMRFSSDGRITSHAELELAVSILEEARWAPQSLSRLLLQQVCNAVASGQGPLRAGILMGPGTITDAEVELTRRILAAGDDSLPVTKSEAAVLFEINATLADPASHAGWALLYVNAIANAVMTSTGLGVAGRRQFLSEAFAADIEAAGSSGPAGAPLRLLSLQPTAEPPTAPVTTVFSTFRPLSIEERALARLERQRIEIITCDELAEPEIEWLVERIDGQMSRGSGTVGPNERRLLALVERHSPALHPALAPLVARAAA